MIKEISVKSLRSPSLLVEKVIEKTKEGILIIETDGPSQIKEVEESVKSYNFV